MISKEDALKRRRAAGEVHWTKKQQRRMCELLEMQARGDCVIAFWNSDQFGMPANGGTTDGWRARPGLVQVIDAVRPVLCGAGAFHATTDHPHRWAGSRVWIVAMHGKVAREDDKIGSLRREFVGEVLPHEAIFFAGLAARLGVKELPGANLTRARLTGANLARAHLEGADLEGAYLAGASLTGANLEGAHLEGAYLEGANLAGADLAGANLTDADLAGANLTGASLTGACLTGAHLEGAYLAGANLAGADLTGAHLAGAYLAGANLARADLTGASLTRARLTGAARCSPDPIIPGWDLVDGVLRKAGQEHD